MAQEEMFDEHKVDVGALDDVKPPKKGAKADAKKPGRKKNGHAAGNVVSIGEAARNVAEQAGE